MCIENSQRRRELRISKGKINKINIGLAFQRRKTSDPEVQSDAEAACFLLSRSFSRQIKMEIVAELLVDNI